MDSHLTRQRTARLRSRGSYGWRLHRHIRAEHLYLQFSHGHPRGTHCMGCSHTTWRVAHAIYDDRCRGRQCLLRHTNMHTAQCDGDERWPLQFHGLRKGGTALANRHGHCGHTRHPSFLSAINICSTHHRNEITKYTTQTTIHKLRNYEKDSCNRRHATFGC